MNPSKGPRTLPKGRMSGPVRLPTAQPHLSAEVLRRYFSGIPLRRAPAPAGPAGPFRTLTPADVDLSLEAITRGEATDLPANGQALTVRLAPAVRAVIEQSGLGPDEVSQVYQRFTEALGNPETVAVLPHWRERPDCALHHFLLSTRDAVHVFTFAIVPRVESGAVLVVGGEHYRWRRT
jgi:hypothetical protein